MGMGIDESGDDGALCTINHGGGGVCLVELCAVADGDNQIVVYSNGTIMHDGAVFVHGNHGCMAKE